MYTMKPKPKTSLSLLPCLEEALDCFSDAGLLKFVTDKEHWNEELLLQFYATLHIRGYNGERRDGSLSG